MRPIDADELMEHAGQDKLNSRELIFRMIENAPTIKEYERGQKDLAKEIYDLIVYDKGSEIIRCSPYTPSKEIAHCFDNILMNIFKVVKEKINGSNES